MLSLSPVTITLPELLQLGTRAKGFSFHAKSSIAVHSGQHLSRLMGRGMEFAETRRYLPGDDIRTIDWRVTARTGKAHTKLFSAEKERQVYICVDLRRPMFFATQGVFKSVQAAILAGTLAWHAVHEGDRIGGLLFTDEQTKEFRPTRGKRGALPFLQALAEMSNFSEAKKRAEKASTMDDAFHRLRTLVRPGSTVFILSDFRRPAAKMNETLYQIARHCDVVLGLIYDPLEEKLPNNCMLPVTNGATELEVNTAHSKSLEKYGLRFCERQQTLKSLSNHRHIQLFTCSTQDDCLQVLRG